MPFFSSPKVVVSTRAILAGGTFAWATTAGACGVAGLGAATGVGCGVACLCGAGVVAAAGRVCGNVEAGAPVKIKKAAAKIVLFIFCSLIIQDRFGLQWLVASRVIFVAA